MPVCKAGTELEGIFSLFSFFFHYQSVQGRLQLSALSFRHSNAQPKPLAKVPLNFKLVRAGKLVCAFIPG